MCTKKEGAEMRRVFSKYYRGGRVEPGDEEPLRRLYEASLIDLRYNGDVLYAEASPTGKMYKPHLLRRPA